MVHVDVSLLRFLADTALPLLAAFLMRRFTSEQVKSIIMTTLAFIMAIVQNLLMLNGDFVFSTFLSNFISALVIGFLTHQFIWKPVGITGDQGVILRTVPAGVGSIDPVSRDAHLNRVASPTGRAA